MLTPLVISTWQKLSTRIVVMLVGFLCLGLTVIGSTLLLTWQLEGSGGAINVTGSLRMDSYRLGMLLAAAPAPGGQLSRAAGVQAQVAQLDNTLALLKRGDPRRPLLLPPAAEIQVAFDHVSTQWHGVLRPQVLTFLAQGIDTPAGQEDLATGIALFVGQADTLVRLIERDSEARAFWLRGSQLALLALALIGTIAIIYMLFNMIIAPVERLQGGIERMRKQDFCVRLPVDSKDEFGRLAQDFNLMADRLHEL